MNKILSICLMVTMATITGSMTADAKHMEAKHATAKTVKPEKATLEVMTVVGTVEKIEKEKPTGPDPKYAFKLTDANGIEVFLPKGEIDQYVGKKVKVTGRGTNADKTGSICIKTITKIEKAEDTPAKPATPATPAK